GDIAHTQRWEARLRTELWHDLLGGAKARRLHRASLETVASGAEVARYAVCSWRGMGAQHLARPVLVVDDDDATRAAEHQVLEEHGFRVIEARDGAEAMRALQQ